MAKYYETIQIEIEVKGFQRMFQIPTVTNDLEDVREMKKAYVHVHTKRAQIIRNSRKTEDGSRTMNGKI